MRLMLMSSSYNVSYAKYTGATYDASTTNLTYKIPPPEDDSDSEPLHVQLSFLSPITPQSTLRQSIPAAYLTVSVEGDFDVDIYVDINGQWVSGDRGSRVIWDFDTPELADKNLKTWKIRKETEQLFTEVRDQAEWGTLYFTGPSVSMLSQGQPFIGITDAIRRTLLTRVAHLHSCDNASQELVCFRIRLTRNFDASWMRSRSSHSPSRSSCPRRTCPRQARAAVV